jgi:hypothetical protein
MKTASKRAAAPAQISAPTENEKTIAKPSPALSKFARQVYESVKDRLEYKFEGFLEGATLEELRFMIEVMGDWDNRNSYGRPRSPGDFEIPIYGAIQRQLDGNICVVVPDDEMVGPVEEFIVALQKKRWKPAPYKTDTPEKEIRAGFEESFRSDADLFARDAGLPSFRLMRDILARWNELHRDPEINKLPNTLAIAAEMELDKYRAEAAAEAAAKGKR